VDDSLVRKALENCNPQRVLPFRFISAAKHAPKFEPELETLMSKACNFVPKLAGKTVVIVDVSGSMSAALAQKSEISRMDAAAALAILIREISEQAVVYVTAGSDRVRIHNTRLIPARRGFALSDLIKKTIPEMGGGGIFLKQTMDYVFEKEKAADRVIVLCDSQDCDWVNKPDSANAFGKHNYLMDISCNKNGIGYSKFSVLNGFSESLVNFVAEYEKLENTTQN
jgi:hypothetical protein